MLYNNVDKGRMVVLQILTSHPPSLIEHTQIHLISHFSYSHSRPTKSHWCNTTIILCLVHTTSLLSCTHFLATPHSSSLTKSHYYISTTQTPSFLTWSMDQLPQILERLWTAYAYYMSPTPPEWCYWDFPIRMEMQEVLVEATMFGEHAQVPNTIIYIYIYTLYKPQTDAVVCRPMAIQVYLHAICWRHVPAWNGLVSRRLACILCRDTVKTIITLRIRHLFKMDAS